MRSPCQAASSCGWSDRAWRPLGCAWPQYLRPCRVQGPSPNRGENSGPGRYVTESLTANPRVREQPRLQRDIQHAEPQCRRGVRRLTIASRKAESRRMMFGFRDAADAKSDRSQRLRATLSRRSAHARATHSISTRPPKPNSLTATVALVGLCEPKTVP